MKLNELNQQAMEIYQKLDDQSKELLNNFSVKISKDEKFRQALSENPKQVMKDVGFSDEVLNFSDNARVTFIDVDEETNVSVPESSRDHLYFPILKNTRQLDHRQLAEVAGGLVLPLAAVAGIVAGLNILGALRNDMTQQQINHSLGTRN